MLKHLQILKHLQMLKHPQKNKDEIQQIISVSLFILLLIYDTVLQLLVLITNLFIKKLLSKSLPQQLVLEDLYN